MTDNKEDFINDMIESVLPKRAPTNYEEVKELISGFNMVLGKFGISFKVAQDESGYLLVDGNDPPLFLANEDQIYGFLSGYARGFTKGLDANQGGKWKINDGSQ